MRAGFSDLSRLQGRYAGALIGQCVGDALGFIVEGATPEHCARYVRDSVRGQARAGLRRGAYPFGQYSDDSQLARELFRSYVACSGFDPADYARRIAALFVERRIVGGGRATAMAANRLAAGVDWRHAGTPAPAAGNGSAMRAAPIGLLCSHDPRLFDCAAYDQGRITHADPRCIAGAIAIAALARRALVDATLDRNATCAELAACTRGHDPVLADAFEVLPRWLRTDARQAATWVCTLGEEPEYARGWDGISGFVTPSVIWSAYAFLRAPDDYIDCVSIAIAAGGDTDTTAAMAGALSGARLGLDAIPSDLAERVNDAGEWDYPALVALARTAACAGPLAD